MKKDSNLNKLDEEQYSVVVSPNNNILCNSIAGSGKTRVLTTRAYYLIKYKKVKPENIMLLTFTNKAANEMMFRIYDMLDNKVYMRGGTFHSIASKYLREYGSYIDLNKYFKILDMKDSKKIIKEIRDELLKEFNISKGDFYKPSVLKSFYNEIIVENRDINDYLFENPDIERKDRHLIFSIIQRYEYRKKENSLLDFSDLLLQFIKLLKQENIKDKIRRHAKYLLVDEYQDLNWMQEEIVNLLGENLFLVGDRNQSIYKFRGAKIKYIEKREKEESINMYNIQTNYRSNDKILEFGECSINKNKQPKKVLLNHYKDNVSLNKPSLTEYANNKTEAENIAIQIKDLIDENVKPSEIAILIRSSFGIVNDLEKSLRKYGVEYELRAGFSFFERKTTKDIMSFLSVSINPNKLDFKRVIRLFSGIGNKTADKMYNILNDYDFDYNIFKDNVNNKNIKVGRGKSSLMSFVDILINIKKIENIEKKIEYINDNFYKEYNLKNRTNDDFEEELLFLKKVSEGYQDLITFLGDVVLESNEKEEEKKDSESIVISTIHRAKGLEWDYVFIPFLNEDFFPSIQSVKNNDIEEERRLFYVAITRAKKDLMLSYSKYFTMYSKYLTKSMFIDEVNKELYHFYKNKDFWT